MQVVYKNDRTSSNTVRFEIQRKSRIVNMIRTMYSALSQNLKIIH